MASNMNMRHPTIQLWRSILRWTRLMPKAQSDYYRRYAKEHLVNHLDEDEEDRIDFLVKKGHEHTAWIVKKYSLDSSKLREVVGARSGLVGTDKDPVDAPSHPGGGGEAEAWDPSTMSWNETASGTEGAAPMATESRPLKGIVVETDVIGQLLVKEVAPKDKHAAALGVLRVGDVLVEIDAKSVRGVPPAQLSVGRGEHTFKFGRRGPDGAEYFEVTLDG